MPRIVIDNAVMADVATELGMTQPQLDAWFRTNLPAINAIRTYVRANRVASDTAIENNAVEGQVLDATLVDQIIRMLTVGGLMTIMEDVTL